MRTFLLTICCLNSISGLSQSKAYDIAFSYGLYTAPNLKQSHNKDYFLTAFDYHITKRWSIISGLTIGKFNYYEDIRSNADLEITKYTTSTTNARGYDSHAYALISYTAFYRNHFYLQSGTGIGVHTQRLKYPYRQPCSSGCEVFIGEESFTSIELPLSLEAYYLPKNRIAIGLKVGGFVKTNLTIIGVHVGPQIRVRL